MGSLARRRRNDIFLGMNKPPDTSVIPEPTPPDWEWLNAVIGPVDEDFERAATEQPPQQDRPELDDFE